MHACMLGGDVPGLQWLSWGDVQAELRVLTGGKVKSMSVKLAQPVRLIPVHNHGRPPSYFIIAGLVFGQARSISPLTSHLPPSPLVLHTHPSCMAATESFQQEI